MKELRVGVAGLGGFAAEHHAALATLEAEGLCRVVATCDPFVTYDRTERGVKVYPSLAAMLAAEKFDLVTLPTPIPLHADQHRMVVKSGAACYLEKPPTLWWPQFQRMLRVEDQASIPTQIGFNFVGDPLRIVLRHRIQKGEFGALLSLGIANFWPRNDAYYARNNWAGRVQVEGQWVLDSPMGNACAHYVQNALFWVPNSEVFEVQASRWRAHPIETWDTIFLAANLTGGITLRIAMTHTGADRSWEREYIELEKARISFNGWRKARIEWNDGRVEDLESEIRDGHQMLVANLRHHLPTGRPYSFWLLRYGDDVIHLDRPTTSLARSANFVSLNTLAHLAEPVRVFSDYEERYGQRIVEGVEEALVPFARDGVVPEFVGALPKPVYRGALGTLQ